MPVKSGALAEDRRAMTVVVVIWRGSGHEVWMFGLARSCRWLGKAAKPLDCFKSSVTDSPCQSRLVVNLLS